MSARRDSAVSAGEGRAGMARDAEGLRRRVARPTRRGVLVACLGALLYGAGANVSAGWVVALAALLLGSLPWGWLTARRAATTLTVRRILPREATAGEPVAVGLELAARAPAVAVVQDGLTGAAGAVTELWRGGDLTGVVVLRRGHAGSGTVHVVLTDLFGLVEVPLSGPVPAELVVRPAVPVLRGPPAGSGWAVEAGQATSRHGSGPEVVGIREYQHGDPLRAVHWRSTARRGHLVVRDLTDRSRPRVSVALQSGPWAQASLDRATEVAAAVAADAARHGLAAAVTADGWAMGWSPSVLRMLALLPPHAGAPPSELGAPVSRPTEVLVTLEPANGGVAVSVTSGGDRRELGTVPDAATAGEVGQWLSGRRAGWREGA